MYRISTLASVVALLGASALSAYGQDAMSLTKPISVGVSGGVAVPSGELANGGSNGFSGTNTGYNVTGSIALALPVIPFGVRIDAGYNRFGTRNLAFLASAPCGSGACSLPAVPGGYNADVRVLAYTANVIYALPWPIPIIRPYILGGGGIYNVVQEPTVGDNYSQTNAGYELGAGAKVPLGGLKTFIEVRYQRVNQHSGSVAFTPISVGVEF